MNMEQLVKFELAGGKGSILRKLGPVPLYPPKIPYGLMED
jgi:hypothetical protein